MIVAPAAHTPSSQSPSLGARTRTRHMAVGVLDVLTGVVGSLLIVGVIVGLLVLFSVALVAKVLFVLAGRSRHEFALVVNRLAGLYWQLLTAVYERWSCTQFHFSGDPLPLRESAVVIMNHRYWLDWLAVLCLARRVGRIGQIKFFIKDAIRYIPLFGWGAMLLDFVFCTRTWMHDRRTIEKTFSNLRENRLPVWLCSHLEGTRINSKKKAESVAFAKANNIEPLEHLLLPRTKGFVATVQALRRGVCSVVYDITIVYRDDRDGTVSWDVKGPQWMNTAMRRCQTSVHMHIRRWPIDELPTDDDELAKWCNARWREKDALIAEFMRNRCFPRGYDLPYTLVPMCLE